MTRRDKFSTKSPTRTLYTAMISKCPICIALNNKSKKFGTPYHLLYHINVHDLDDQTTTLITLEEIRLTVKQICKAIEWGMFFV